MTSASPHIILVGCGKMGGAMLRGWLDAKIGATFSVIDPTDMDIQGANHFRAIEDAKDALKNASMLIMAVKPQIMAGICRDLAPHISDNTTILSIAAGQSIASFEGYFGPNQPIIRTMPNLPAAIGKGMSAGVTNTHVTGDTKTLADTLMTCAGKMEWLEDESTLDAVTALSGSGPAYIFHLIETLAKSGESIGLPAETAMTLARQTVIGAAALAETDADIPASTLRENVTSPGGTTAAALDVLMDGRIQKIYDEALQAAKARSEELNK